MSIKKILLITAVSSLLSFGVAQANDNAVYQITSVKGKALVQLPNGKRTQAKSGMEIVDGSELIVLRNSVVNGFDIQNKCEVEYQQLVRTSILRGKMCAAAPVVASNLTTAGAAGGAGGIGAGAAAGGGSLGLLGAGAGGMGVAGALAGLAGLGLLAAALDDDDPASP